MIHELHGRGTGAWRLWSPIWRVGLAALALGVGAASAAEPIDALLILDTPFDARDIGSRAMPAARPAAVYAHLSATAAAAQAPILAELSRRSLDHEAFHIARVIRVRAGAAELAELATLPGVARVERDRVIPQRLPTLEAAGGETRAVEPGLTRINAPAVWALGFRGQGVTVAGQDTGYRWDHAALRASYRGTDGTNVSHDYHWFDGVRTGGGAACPAASPLPCDDNNHGTHTMGTIVGHDGGANEIGVAPGARWIGCRNMDAGNGTPSTYLRCMQWFLAPTDVNGQNPNPAMAPDVINNSWGCPPSEGCTVPDVLAEAVGNLRAAGILFVASAGNSGSACSTVVDPPAIYAASLVVGASNVSDAMASFSSRGPVMIDGSGRMKPDLVAPGVSVRSALRNGGYGSLSGTSMAGPHVAGAAALLISADPTLRRQPERLEQLLTQSSVNTITSTQVCGGITPPSIPNPVYGHGRLDVLRAVQMAIDRMFSHGFEG